jgi:hypothetical protein
MNTKLFLIALLAGGWLSGCTLPDFAAPGTQVGQPPVSVAAGAATSMAVIIVTQQPINSPTAEPLPDLPPISCPVTTPQEPVFQPPPPYSPESPYPGEFWYGSNDLWTLLPTNGSWYGLPIGKKGYSQKVVWWREGYQVQAEPQPELIVTGRRLDSEAPPLLASRATNGFNPDIGAFMLTGIEIPTPGCWEISGKYHRTTLTFVVWVAPGQE